MSSYSPAYSAIVAFQCNVAVSLNVVKYFDDDDDGINSISGKLGSIEI